MEEVGFYVFSVGSCLFLGATGYWLGGPVESGLQDSSSRFGWLRLVPPHPYPLPQGEGTTHPAPRRVQAPWIDGSAEDDSPPLRRERESVPQCRPSCDFMSEWSRTDGSSGVMPQGCIKLLDFSLSSIGWRRGLGRGGAFLLVSPLLGPLPTRSSRGEDAELDAALRAFAAAKSDLERH